MATKKQETKGFSLSKLKPASDTITVELKFPFTDEVLGYVKGEPIPDLNGNPQYITVYANYSREYRKFAHEQAVNRMNKLSQGNGPKKATTITFDEYEDGSTELLAKTTVGWSLEDDGKLLPLSVESAKEIYDTYFWIKEQVMEAQSNLENFMKS